MLKILQARLQQYVNHELPNVPPGFRKGRRTRDQIANIHWIIEKAREFQKNIYFCFIDYTMAFECVDHNKLWKNFKEMGIPDHLICLLRNLVYAGQEATVRTGHGTTNWFQIRKGVRQSCILSPCLFNLYAVYIMRIHTCRVHAYLRLLVIFPAILIPWFQLPSTVIREPPKMKSVTVSIVSPSICNEVM